MKTWIKMLYAVVLMLAGTFAFAAPAAAQATRTWVSGVGDDANPCSRTAPCKTFAGAISKTAAGGEINCLDPGGWGTVTITKSMTIDCSQFPGSILNASVPGITVNAGANDVVVIRGLEINGSLSSPGTFGIRFLSGASLQLENVVIRGDTLNDAAGISFVPSTNAKLLVRNTVISQAGAGAGAGIFIQPNATGTVQATIEHSSIFGVSAPGIKVDGSNGGSAGVVLQVTNSVIAGNSFGLFLFSSGGSAVPVKAILAHNTIANNTNTGLLVNGATITALASDTTINNNGQGVINAGGTVLSYQDNPVFSNGSNNTFPATISKQ